MCYKIRTPTLDHLKCYLQKNSVSIGEAYEIDDYTHYFVANGFENPYLPITSSDHPLLIKEALWKLIPNLEKNLKEAKKYSNTINIPCERLFTSASLKKYITGQRCLLWVQGFYELHYHSKDETVPYYIVASNCDPFTIGGVYNDWLNQETGEIIKTFAIITTSANEFLKEINNKKQRMPLIIKAEDRKKWIEQSRKDEIIEMMKPVEDGYLDGNPFDMQFL